MIVSGGGKSQIWTVTSDFTELWPNQILNSTVNKNNSNTKLCWTFSVFLKPFSVNWDWGMLGVINKIRKHMRNQMWRSSLRPIPLFVRGLYSLTALILLWVCFPTPCLRLLVQWKEQFLLTLLFLTVLLGLRIVVVFPSNCPGDSYHQSKD